KKTGKMSEGAYLQTRFQGVFLQPWRFQDLLKIGVRQGSLAQFILDRIGDDHRTRLGHRSKNTEPSGLRQVTEWAGIKNENFFWLFVHDTNCHIADSFRSGRFGSSAESQVFINRSRALSSLIFSVLNKRSTAASYSRGNWPG